MPFRYGGLERRCVTAVGRMNNAMVRQGVQQLRYWSRAGRRRIRDAVLSNRHDTKTTREDIALKYIAGSGIEIGALNFPLRLPRRASVRYVDFLSPEVLREHHAHLLAAGQYLRMPDVVDDGETLGKFGDASVDFVIANHFIEHTEDPIATLANHLRVLRAGGVLYMAVPDKRHTYDRDRELTSLEHLIRDHVDGPEGSRGEHYREWARFVDGVAEDAVDAHASELARRRFSIHFHVWTMETFLDLLLHCQRSGMPFNLELIERNGEEFVVVLRRQARGKLRDPGSRGGADVAKFRSNREPREGFAWPGLRSG